MPFGARHSYLAVFISTHLVRTFFPVGIVHHDNHASGAQVIERLVDRGKSVAVTRVWHGTSHGGHAAHRMPSWCILGALKADPEWRKPFLTLEVPSCAPHSDRIDE